LLNAEPSVGQAELYREWTSPVETLSSPGKGVGWGFCLVIETIFMFILK
jgi:hypothetical protein